MCLQLAEVLPNATYEYVWNNLDIYDYYKFMAYNRYKNFRDKVYQKRLK